MTPIDRQRLGESGVTAPELIDDCLHQQSSSHIRWTTVNLAEVQPGVLTPLGWSFWRDPCEAGCRGGFADLGILRTSEIQPPDCVDERIAALFYGRYAGNLTTICDIADRTPGTSGEDLEIQIFGGADPAVKRVRSRRRYPAVVAKLPWHVARIKRRSLAVRAEIDSWWRTSTSVDGRAVPPLDRIRQAQQELQRAMRLHMAATMIAQGCYVQLCALALSAGKPGLELTLTTGYGDMEESRVGADLWKVSRGTLALPDFLAAHGYHGPSEGELSSRSWREDPRILETLCTAYRLMTDDQAPERRAQERVAARRHAEHDLLQAVPWWKRPVTHLTLRAGATFLPLREVGKASFLQAVDVARDAARQIGKELVAEGLLVSCDDVFMLTLDELRSGSLADAATLVEKRRVTRERFRRLRLPERWVGMPSPADNTEAPLPNSATKITGVPASPGLARGRVRIITDPAESDEFEPGDVLVCETTDPSWVVLFQLAAAVVIDVGGPLSHGAIVARELGLPAVINTRTGTRVLPDGATVVVDGSAGVVEIVCS